MNPRTENFKTKRAPETWVVDQVTGLSDLETRDSPGEGRSTPGRAAR